MSDEQRGNPLLTNRRKHMNSNGFVLGTSGAGKSFNPVPAAVRELLDSFGEESRPERAIVLDGHAWNLLAESYGDLIGEQPDGFLRLQFVFHGPDNDFRFDPFDGFLHRRHDVGGGGAMV